MTTQEQNTISLLKLGKVIYSISTFIEISLAKAFHGKPTDIWAAGGTLFYFLVGRPPFHGNDAEELKRKVQDEE